MVPSAHKKIPPSKLRKQDLLTLLLYGTVAATSAFEREEIWQIEGLLTTKSTCVYGLIIHQLLFPSRIKGGGLDIFLAISRFVEISN